MKRTFVTAFAAIIMVANANGQSSYLSTGFDEGIPSSFTLHDADGRTPSTDMQKLGFAVGTPWIVVTEGKEGNKVACSTSWYKNAGQSDDWMVTGAIDIKSKNAVLKWRARASDKTYRDGYKIYVSETGAEVNDFDRTESLFSVSQEAFSWTEHSLSLEKYAGKTIYIAFVNDSKDKTCLYVDDIFIGIPSNVGITPNLSRVINQYGEVALTGQVFATGDKDVTSYSVGYRIGNQSYEQDFDTPLKTNEKTDFTLDRKFHIDRNQTLDYAVWVKSGADSTGISGAVSAYPWKIVSEEITGTWCGYCPRGAVAMKRMNEKYPDSFIGIAVHSSSPAWFDAMAEGVENYNSELNSLINAGYPHCIMNRNVMYSIDPANLESYYNSIRTQSSNNCGVQVSASYDYKSDKINAVTDIYFASDIENADYRLAYVVIENGVHRTNADLGLPDGAATGYEQNNYYAGTTGDMGGFENLPPTVPADKMWYDDVARAIYPDFKGADGLFPTEIADGDHFTHTYSMDIPKNILEGDNTELIVLLIDKNGIIANADKVKIEDGTTGISLISNDAENETDKAYYNLNGMRISKPGNGVYIYNGKKYIRQQR